MHPEAYAKARAPQLWYFKVAPLGRSLTVRALLPNYQNRRHKTSPDAIWRVRRPGRYGPACNPNNCRRLKCRGATATTTTSDDDGCRWGSTPQWNLKLLKRHHAKRCGCRPNVRLPARIYDIVGGTWDKVRMWGIYHHWRCKSQYLNHWKYMIFEMPS